MSDGRTKTAAITTRRGADALAVSLMFVFVTGAVTLSVMPVVRNDLQSLFGFSDADIGLLSTVFLGFYGVAGITSGVFAARWGGRLLAVSCGSFVVGSVLFGVSSSFGGFLAGRAIQGIGGGMVVAVCSPVIAHAVREEWRSRVWGIFGSGWGIGSMAALLILPSIDRAGGFRAVFFVTAGLALVVGVGAMSQRATRALPQHPEGVTTLRGLVRSLRSVMTNHRVILAGFANTADLAISVGVLVWAPAYLENIRGATASTSLYLVAGLGAAQVIGNPLGAAAYVRWGKYSVVTLSVLAITLVTALEGVLPGIIVGFALVLLNGFFSMLLFPPMMGMLPDIVEKPEHVGPATGINSFMGFVGSMIAPWLFGKILDASKPAGNHAAPASAHAFLAGFAMLAAFGLAAFIGMLFFRPGKVEAWQQRGRKRR
jgi:MFS family permease